MSRKLDAEVEQIVAIDSAAYKFSYDRVILNRKVDGS